MGNLRRQYDRPVWTILTRGDEYADVSLESFPTGDIDVRGQSADNAAFTCKVRIQYSVPNNDAEILKLVAKFGFNPETRDAKILNSIFMELQSKISSKAKVYNAYDLLDKYEAVREPVLAEMKDYFTKEMHLVLENLQFVGKPDFDNNDIDTASSNTVAAQQKKNAALADLERVKVEAETKQVQALTFAQSPQLMELERLKYQVQMTENLGKTTGILVFGENSPLTFTKSVKQFTYTLCFLENAGWLITVPHTLKKDVKIISYPSYYCVNSVWPSSSTLCLQTFRTFFRRKAIAARR